MATDADRVIAALHAVALELDPIVRGLTPELLASPSAASEWEIGQVLSHLGSGAVIGLAALDAARDGRPGPGQDANRLVWAVWDAMSRPEQAAGYLSANADLLARYDGLDEAARRDLRIELGFLPQPVDVAGAARFRLAEAVLHSWDVRVALDPAATLTAAAVPEVLDVIDFFVGWVARPAALGRDAVLSVTLPDAGRAFGLRLASTGAAVEDVPQKADGLVAMPAEGWVRLVAGRLSPDRTPPGVEVLGGIGLDDLRRAFPGY